MRDLKIPDQRHPEKAHRPDQEQPKKPSWIRVKAPTSEGYRKTRDIMKENRLVTVCEEAGCPNIGVTLDFAHVLYAGEMPAYAATLAARHSRILGVHLNDGYGKRDDGLMAGTVHPIQTLELFVALDRAGYDGVIYFDTFPDHAGLDPAAESRANIALTDRLRDIARSLAQDPALASAIAAQDAAASTRLLAKRLYG